MPCPLRAAALAAPDTTAILSVRRTISYAELDRMVSATTTRLLEAGCEPGMRVALYLPHGERYPVLLLALLRAGCVSCPLSTRLPSEGASLLLDKAACSALISEDEELLGKISSGVRGIRPGALLAREDGDVADPAYLPLRQPVTIVFTSGSTGRPKAAQHTFGNHYYSALGSNANIALSVGDRWLLSLPLYHVGGISIVFRCLLAGATDRAAGARRCTWPFYFGTRDHARLPRRHSTPASSANENGDRQPQGGLARRRTDARTPPGRGSSPEHSRLHELRSHGDDFPGNYHSSGFWTGGPPYCRPGAGASRGRGV